MASQRGRNLRGNSEVDLGSLAQDMMDTLRRSLGQGWPVFKRLGLRLTF